MLKRFDFTRGRHAGATERGRDWAGGQFLSLRGDPCGILVRDRKILACSRKGKMCQYRDVDVARCAMHVSHSEFISGDLIKK